MASDVMPNITQSSESDSNTWEFTLKWGNFLIVAIIGGIGLVIKSLIAKYIVKHTPKNRPINDFILMEQVNEFRHTIIRVIVNTKFIRLQ